MKMIRQALVAAIVLVMLMAGGVEAQTIGFKLGPSFSTLSTDGDGDPGTLTKFTGGGFIRFGFNRFAVQPELMYVTKGAQETVTEDGESIDVDLELDYVEIPVLLVLEIPAASVSPFLYAGPAFAFEVGCSFSLTGGGVSLSADCDDVDEEDSGDRKKFDIGAMIGGGLAIPMGPGAITLEGRYNFGLRNLADSDEGTLRNRSGAVLVGFSIPFGG